MKKVELTNKAFEALCYLAYENPCRSGCCIAENQDKRVTCDTCDFTIGKYELQRVIEEMNQ